MSGLMAVMLLAQKERGGMTSDSVALKGGPPASLCFGMAPMACSSSCFSRKGFSMALTRRQAHSCVNQAECKRPLGPLCCRAERAFFQGYTTCWKRNLLSWKPSGNFYPSVCWQVHCEQNRCEEWICFPGRAVAIRPRGLSSLQGSWGTSLSFQWERQKKRSCRA